MQMTPEALVRHHQTRINEIQHELAIVKRERDRAKELSDRMVEQSRMQLEKRDAAEARARENSERGERLVAGRKELKTRIDEAKAEALEALAQLVEAQKQLAAALDNLWAAEDRIVVLNALLKTTQAQKEAALRRLRELTPRHVPAAQGMTVLRVTGGGILSALRRFNSNWVLGLHIMLYAIRACVALRLQSRSTHSLEHLECSYVAR